MRIKGTAKGADLIEAVGAAIASEEECELERGITYRKHDNYWYEDSCWKCGISATQVCVKDRTRYPNVADTAWVCRRCWE